MLRDGDYASTELTLFGIGSVVQFSSGRDIKYVEGSQ